MHKFGLLIGAPELSGLLGSPDLRVIDCRFNLLQPAEGRRQHGLGHIPGAVYADLEGDLSGPRGPDTGRHPLPDRQVLATTFGRHGVDDRTQVVVYDDSGGTMAVRLWWLLRWLGHRDVALLDGGWTAWSAAGLPVDTAAPRPPVTRAFTGRPDWRQVVDTQEIAQQLRGGDTRVLLMDARTRERFRGDVEPIDPVAGHIPGAINLPLQDNLEPDGTFRSAQALRARYEAALRGRSPGAVAAMCGSGVTACHNLLAMEVAGLPGGRLYAGSWSEWIRDPDHPVARGDT